jgi:hypothetical protein
MACGCAGSTQRQERQQQRVAAQQQQQQPRRTGGPGQPGYTWNGPRVPAQKPQGE